jgi:hypothetical protein
LLLPPLPHGAGGGRDADYSLAGSDANVVLNAFNGIGMVVFCYTNPIIPEIQVREYLVFHVVSRTWTLLPWTRRGGFVRTRLVAVPMDRNKLCS